MESYQHVFDRTERDNLAQIMYSVMRQRPRFDFSADYFLRTYRLESINLRMQATLVKNILDTQVSNCQEESSKFRNQRDYCGSFHTPRHCH